MLETEDKGVGGSMGERIACTPATLEDLPVGMWEIVYHGRYGFELDGHDLATYIGGDARARICLKLLNAGRFRK